MDNNIKRDFVVYALDADNKQVFCTKRNTTLRGVKMLYNKLTKLVFNACVGDKAEVAVSCGWHAYTPDKDARAPYKGEVDMIGFHEVQAARKTAAKKLVFYSDPGHGWLKVSLRELVKLGIADKITSFSYVRGRYAYLEEDCDAGVYMEALKASRKSVKFEVEEHNSNNDSPIRDYDPYTPARALGC